MQTLTIRVDESYLEQILAFLQQIPKNKREIFQHTKMEIPEIQFEKIDKSDSDYQFILDAKVRRENGEKTFSLESVLKEFE